MSDATFDRQIFDLTEEPVRRGFSDHKVRLDLRGNFDRAVEVTAGLATRDNARRGR
jgi:hypothetical protein